MSNKSSQLEALLSNVIPATQSAETSRPTPKAVRPKQAIDPKWLEEERETFDCPVIVKRHLARLAVDDPEISVRGLYLKAVAANYDLDIPEEVLRDRRRRRT